MSSVGLLTTGSLRSPPVFLILIFSSVKGFCCCGETEEKHAVFITNPRPIRDSNRGPPRPRVVSTTFANALTVLQFVVVVVIAVKRKDMILLLLSFQPMLLYLFKLGSLFTSAVIFVAIGLHAGALSISNCFLMALLIPSTGAVPGQA